MLVQNYALQNYETENEITPLNDQYSIMHAPVSRFNMCNLGIYPYYIFPSIYTVDSQISHIRSEITSVQNNPNLALFGQGVLIGFVDTGIDYRHNAFRNPDDTTKIFSLWDQTIETGIPPSGFNLGTEYSKTIINQALFAPDPLSIVSSIDENGHGTMMAGIAAGSVNDIENFSGVAPAAELIVVKMAPAKSYNKRIFSLANDTLCYPETNIMLGVEYIRRVATALNRPLVICIGVGSSQGAHSGHGALATLLNSLSLQVNMSACISAGNEGNSRRHYRGTIAVGQNFRDFELRVSQADPDFFMEIWQKPPCRLAIELTSPTGEHVPYIAPRLNECREHNFILESTLVIINNIILEEESGDQLILCRFDNAMSGIWRIRAIDIDDIASQFDVWLPSGDLISAETYFPVPDPNVTITSPGNAHNPMTVTAYNQVDNSILISSSRGFTSDNVVKPDFAAPGYQLHCPVPNNDYGTATGSGAAAAHAAGIVAMLLEWAVLKGNYTTITGRDIARLLIRGARRESNIVYPNTIWGYGQIDILGVFRSLI